MLDKMLVQVYLLIRRYTVDSYIELSHPLTAVLHEAGIHDGGTDES